MSSSSIFPNSDLGTAKTRPALIVQRDDLNSGISQVIVCMITSKIFRANHPSRVKVLLSSSEGRDSGLLADSVVVTDNLATIASLAIDRVIGILPLANVDPALRHTLGL